LDRDGAESASDDMTTGRLVMTELGRNTKRTGRIGAAMLLLCLSAGWAQAAAETIPVMLDKAKILKMPPHAETIVVGNPIIADVTTLKNNGLVVVTGKGYGETNLIFLDNKGAAIEEANVRVQAAGSLMTVQRGMDRESYSCQPRCEPTVSLGDSTPFLKDASGQISSRNLLASPGTH
jgi:Flp pilus assembly secretin CpaC